MGDVIKDFYKSDAPQFKGRSKEKRREMAIAAKLTAERGPQNESATEVAMSPDELALQKRKTRIDKMITMKRQQALQKAEVKADVKEATYPSDFINPDGSKRSVAKKKDGRPIQHDQPTKGGRRKTVDEAFKQFPEKKVTRKIQREKDRLTGGVDRSDKASGSQVQGRQDELNRKRAGRIMKMSNTMNDKTFTSPKERSKMNARAQKTVRTVDRIKDRQVGGDTSKSRSRSYGLKPKLRGKTVDESAEDRLRDQRMERGGVAGNVDYRRPAKNAATGSKKKYDGMSALAKVKAELEKKHGKGSVM